MPKKGQKRRRAHGQISQSQLIMTFGPGAMLDLPAYSVLIGGLDGWYMDTSVDIHEPRLAQKVCQLLDVPSIRLRTPPAEPDDERAPATGVTAWQFPEYFVTEPIPNEEDTPADRKNVRRRKLVHRRELTGKRFNTDGKNLEVIPVRFVRACKLGHIGDIDWKAFVHEGQMDCKRRLWLEERGTSGDLTEIFVRCDCTRERSMAQASRLAQAALGYCDGGRPWLGRMPKERCSEPSRLLIRSASNAYFREFLSVISLPDRHEQLKEAVDLVWDFVSASEGPHDIEHERKKERVGKSLRGFSNEEVFAEVQARRSGSGVLPKSVKQAELETLLSTQEEIGEDKPDGKFFARALPERHWKQPWMNGIRRVVLVHRLQEVTALVGFTRFEPEAPDIEGELDIEVHRAALAQDLSWVPAMENKGEGVFIEFDREVVESWLESEPVKRRVAELEAGFALWKQEQGSTKDFPGAPYMMLHSFAHLLITAVSLECGYPCTSIRERVYAIPNTGYGVLIYTGSVGSEGTLGGLIEAGRRIAKHVLNALEMGQLCSNDPVCAQHAPETVHEHRFLHGAACHGCLLISETCCEQYNDLLDRVLVVPTVDNRGAEFFPSAQK